MKKENRLKKRKQFNWTFKNGDTIHSKDLIIVYTSSKSKDYKIGFSVSKKVGNSVVRNHTRRWLREAVSKYSENIKGKHTAIFVAKPSIINAEFLDVVKQVEYLLKKSKLYNDEL